MAHKCSIFLFLFCFFYHVLGMLKSLKKFQTSKLNLEVGVWAQGHFWIENRNWKTRKKLKISDDYLFLGIKYCQNNFSKLHFTCLLPLHALSFLSILDIGLKKHTKIGYLLWALSKFFLDVWNFFNFAKPLTYCLVFFCSVLYIVCTVNVYI